MIYMVLDEFFKCNKNITKKHKGIYIIIIWINENIKILFIIRVDIIIIIL